MSAIIESIERRQLKQVPRFEPGDRVRVHFEVVEGDRRRTQVFEGIVIKRQGSGARETFTVRKQSFGVGVERTFPVHSPKIERLEVAGRGAVRRAKLYYLRDRVGKRARVAERRWGIEDELVAGGADEGEAVDSEGVTQADLDAEAGEADAAEGGDAAGEAEADGGADEDPRSDDSQTPDVSAEADSEAGSEDASDGGEPEEGSEDEPDEGGSDAETGGEAGAEDEER